MHFFPGVFSINELVMSEWEQAVGCAPYLLSSKWLLRLSEQAGEWTRHLLAPKAPSPCSSPSVRPTTCHDPQKAFCLALAMCKPPFWDAGQQPCPQIARALCPAEKAHVKLLEAADLGSDL